MIIQNRDGSLVCEDVRQLPATHKYTYYAELPADRLDEQAGLFETLFSYAIDVLNARHVEVRVMPLDEMDALTAEGVYGE